MTIPALLAQAESVKHAVASPETCCSSTVSTLECLLSTKPAVCAVGPKRQPATVGKVATAARTNLKPGRASKARIQYKVTGQELPQHQERSLDPFERLVLATEVSNISLNTLTQAAKHVSRPRRQQFNTASRAMSQCASANHSVVRPTTKQQQPLQSRSINRVSSSPSESSLRRSSSCTSIGPRPGLRAVAECARIVLGNLRCLYAQGVPKTEIPALKLEAVSSALVGKLIALDLDDLALKELCILKRRLETPSDAVDWDGTQSQELGSGKETPAGLLPFERADAEGPELALMVQVQMHALRLAESKKSPSVLAAMLRNMQLSVPGSPGNLILKTASKGPPSAVAKASQQLATMAHILLSFSPSMARSEDNDLEDARAALHPRTAFEAQVLAFELRLLSWKTSGHNADIQKELHDPFAKCLATYTRRTSENASLKYELATEAFERLRAGSDDLSSVQSGFLSTHTSLSRIFLTLAELAQACSLLEEAIRWSVSSSSLSCDDPAYGAIHGASVCKVALLRLVLFEKSGHTEDLEDSLIEATDVLEGPLHGESADLDELMTVVAALRRGAMSWITKLSAASRETRDLEQQSPSFRMVCSQLVQTCLKFFARYIGTMPRDGVNSKPLARYEQRRKLSSSAARSAIESVIAISKITLGASQLAWKKLDSALQDCVELLTLLDDGLITSEGAKPEPGAGKQLLFVNLSNVYWLYYLRTKKTSGPPSELVRSLQRSVELLKDRPNTEKDAGFLAVKLERLGALHESLGKLMDAHERYAEAVRLHIDLGVMSKVSCAARNRPLVDVWEGEGMACILGKALASWIRVGMRKDLPSRVLFDDETLPLDERGLLLEWQLTVATRLLDIKNITDRQRRSILTLANLLLSTYHTKTFPIRRLRVILCLIRIDAKHTDIVDECLMDTLAGELKDQSWQVSSANDEGLAGYQTHLRASAAIALAFHGYGRPSTTTLQTVLRIWSDLLDECRTWRAVGERVENRHEWILQVQTTIDFLEMQGQEMPRISALQLMGRIQEKQHPFDHSAFIRSMSDTGLQFSRLGYSGKAGLALSRATRYVDSGDGATEIRVRWHLAYAEYLVEIGNFEKCEEYLTRAGQLAQEDAEFLKNAHPSATLRGRVRLNRLIADALYGYSQLALAQGHPEKALALAKCCVRLNYRAWSGLERQLASLTTPTRADPQDVDHSGLNESFSMLTVSACNAPPVMSTTHEVLNGPLFWPLVPSIYRGLALLSRLFDHQGMFLEAIYYNEQAQKVVEAVGAVPWIRRALATSGDYWTRCGHTKKGEDSLVQAQQLSMEIHKSRDDAILHNQLAYLHKTRCNWEGESDAYRVVDTLLKELTTAAFISHLERPAPAGFELEHQMTKLNLQDNQPSGIPSGKQQSRKPTKTRTKSRDQASDRAVTSAQTFASQCTALLRLKGDVLRQHALSMILQHQTESATWMLAEAEELPKSQFGYIQQRLAVAKHLLLQAHNGMTKDAVFCVLPDSTISLPAVASASTSNERQVGERIPSKIRKPSPPRKTAVRPGSRKVVRSKTPTLEDFRDILAQAKESIADVQMMAVQTGSTSTLHVVSNVLSTILMLLSAANSPTIKSIINPYFTAYSTEIGRIVPLQRQQSCIRFDQQSLSQEEIVRWPSTNHPSSLQPKQSSLPVNCSSFQRDYVDIIPAKWNVISISLSESRDEIYINKLQGGLTPFMLRLPLSRHNSRDADEDIFDFDQGEAELSEIIELANFSAQDARNMSGAKSQWWAEREALDGRLKDLLANIEKIWLGGFRGVFAQHLGRSYLLARFQHSFQNILDKYLPSRQAVSKRAQASRVNLDSRILELFLGLAECTDVSELEEPLTDLLYFVVDILQFHGERNAYDEVDFDSIIVETSDAIRCYHEAVQAEKMEDSGHTILILDKALHVIPWESLSCLDGQSVSRLPSLGCLRQRILLQQEKSNQESPERLYVDRGDGAYVLNPSGDLKSTQGTFERPLQELAGWDRVVQREPSETEVKTALESRDIYLYFGHGSGAQYIRSRIIKGLDRCAVSLLMGCSSGALTEAGEFEPYGTPINYMHAGCPALVATLWDVTDKDIDRFSYAVLNRWGLFKRTASEGTKSPVKSGGRRAAAKWKAKEEDCALSGESVSLVEAVAKGRSSCILRYLNGGAPVVYGIPVYLS